LPFLLTDVTFEPELRETRDKEYHSALSGGLNTMSAKQFRNLCVFVATLGAVVFHASVLAQPGTETGFLNRVIAFGGREYRYQVYVPASYSAMQQWPLIMFLHGSGECGTDGLLQTQVGLGSAIRQNAKRYPAIVVFPQAPVDSLWVGGPAGMAMAALNRTMHEFRVDSDRVYLTGLSIGGNGTWYLAYRHPSTFAAIVPVCGWIRPFPEDWSKKFDPVVPGDTTTPFATLAHKLGSLPVWIFHGEEDRSVPVEESRNAAAALQEEGTPVHFTELPGMGHNAWDAAYGSTKLVDWLFAQRRHH
jgi:predicted peptidase